jgi:Na+/proline symporter/signal transduction histidine kinase/CheY-like chemotaxis protein
MTVALIFVALCYVGILFWMANWGDKTTPNALKISHHPFVYALSLGIYCTSWTYYGAVGTAATSSWHYLSILLGPALLFIFAHRFLQKLILVSKKQNITTIADFISARYGKRQTTAVVVTLIALLATIPYIALQLKALSNSFLLLQQDEAISGVILALTGTFIMALFAIFFGTRKVDVTEYRSGLMLAIAFESLIKLLALAAVAILAFISLYKQSDPLLSLSEHWRHFDFFNFNFIGQSLMAAAAIICLPRQFHVTVVDNQDRRHLHTARWAFPLYLFLTAAMIIPIATAAIHPNIGLGVAADSFVLALPLIRGHSVISTFVFIGGLSAATAMIVVATLTLSTMLSNDVVLPLFLKRKFKYQPITKNYKSQILLIRRFIIAVILLLAYLYQQWFGHGEALANMGLVAFSLVTQLLPAIVFGLYWRKGHAYGVYAGLLAGLICWVLFLMLPVLDAGAMMSYHVRQNTITQGTLIALCANIFCYLSFSLAAHERLIDKIQAAAFVNPKEHAALAKRINKNVKANVYDFKVLLQTFLGVQRSEQLLGHYSLSHNIDDNNAHPTPEFIAYCERSLTGVLGASSAQALVHAVASGKQMAFEEVVNFFDETTQALQFNQNLLYTALENLGHGISVVDKDLKLVAWNKRYSEMFNYPKGFLDVGLSIEKVIRFNANRGDCGPGEVEQQVEKRVQHLRNGTSHHFIRHRRDGQVYEMIGNPLPEGGFVTSFSDITMHITTQNALEDINMDLENRIESRTQEIRTINTDLESQIASRIETEQALIKAKKDAENANDSKTRFLALASHDILQPLNAARLYLAAINEQGLSPQDQGNFIKLGDSLDSTVHLMSALLDIAKLEQGAMNPSHRHFNIHDILNPIASEYAMLSKEKGLTLKVRNSHHIVYSDITYLRRIIQNLVSNAVKYTDKGKVLVACRTRKNNLRIEVWDTGPGISHSEQKKIFNDFYRIESGDNKGVGLGLGVVKRLCESLSVKLNVDSLKHKGSRFSIDVPYGDIKQAPQQPEKQTLFPTNNNKEKLSLFAVDDDPNNLSAMASLFDKWQVNYQLYNNVNDALAYAQKNKAPDMILMDYQLDTDCDGIALIKTLREIWRKQVPAVLITAMRHSQLKTQVKTLNIHYLSKPIKPAKLKALLTHQH